MSIKNTPVLLIALALVLGPSANAFATECATVSTDNVPSAPSVRVCPPDPITR